jgi:cytochrome c biogenesis protein CcmG/thiol:disulfide interchange protein DsbE
MEQITKEKIYMIFPAILLVIIAILIYYRFVHMPSKKSPVNEHMPQISAPLLLRPNEQMTNNSLGGKVDLIVFWQSNCVQCKEEHELLMYIATSHLVTLYGIDFKDNPNKARAYLKAAGNPYKAIAIDHDGRIGLLLNLQTVPEAYLVDKHGVIRDVIPGPITPIIWFDRLQPEIEKMKN